MRWRRRHDKNRDDLNEMSRKRGGEIDAQGRESDASRRKVLGTNSPLFWPQTTLNALFPRI
jgi:hypothetical protein